MAARYWIKLYHEILDDPKVARLPDRIWRRVIELFLIAGDANADGLLPPVGDMAWRLRLDEAEFIDDLHEIEACGIIHNDGGCWVVTRFAARQAAVSDAERMRRLRDRNQEAQYQGEEPVTIRNVIVTDTVTSRNVDKIRSDTDEDTDSETDKRSSSPFLAKAIDLYHSNIGMLGPIQADEVKAIILELEADGLESWWAAAIKIAVDQNVRKWSYVKAIIEKCLSEGHPPGADNGKRGGGKGVPKARDASDYVNGEYGDYIQT